MVECSNIKFELKLRNYSAQKVLLFIGSYYSQSTREQPSKEERTSGRSSRFSMGGPIRNVVAPIILSDF